MYYYLKLLETREDNRNIFIKNRIEELEEESKRYENDLETIGYYLDYNPVSQTEKDNVYIDMCGIYKGYARKGTRIVFGISFMNDKKCLVGNDGNYYYIDTDDYIYEFCDWIKDIKIEDEFELFYCIQKFIKKYFGTIPSMNREKMFQLIYKDDYSFFKPLKEHGLSWFKEKGNAMCTEYAVLAQNLLSFFGIQSYLLFGEEKENNDSSEYHAFNFISCKDDDTGNECMCLMDFAMPVGIYNLNHELKGEFPYTFFLEDFDEDDLMDYYENEKVFSSPDHMYMMINDDIMEISLSTTREYCVKHEIIPKIVENKIKKNNFMI